MAEFRATPVCAAGQSTRFKEAVCMEAERIFDSCSDKDCLEDLQVFFSSSGHSVIDASPIIKCRSAEVADTYLTVEAVPFNRGYYATDMTFYFIVNFSCYSSPASTPVNVRGLACHTKKVVLYGGEGGVKTFYSDATPPDPEAAPCACLKSVDPIVLSSRIIDCIPACSEPPVQIPDGVALAFDGEIITQPGTYDKVVLVTLGVFTIVTLQRSVQLMVPAYDYVVPEKDCGNSTPDDDPCEVFRRIKFPKDEFFPEDLNEASCRNRSC